MQLPLHRTRRRLDVTTGKIIVLSEPVQFIRTWAQAEENAAAWMRALGYRDALVTKTGADGGIDVRSKRTLAQVKWKSGSAGRPDLQRLFGARGTDYRKELWFFDSAGYTKQALKYAEECSMLLFTYTATGELEPANKLAEQKLTELLTRRIQRMEKWRAHQRAKQGHSAPVRPVLTAISEATLDELFAKTFPDPRKALLLKEEPDGQNNLARSG